MSTETTTPYIETLLQRVAARGATLGVRLETGAPVRVVQPGGKTRDITSRAKS
jgi:hypothetical protein